MRLTAILATDVTGAIGNGDKLPWPKMSRDLRRFREATMDKVCIVGRRTFATMPPLPGRRLVVVSRSVPSAHDLQPSRVGLLDLAHTFASAPLLAEHHGAEEAMVIGGAEVYRALLPRCDRLLLTVVHGEWPANTYLERPTEGFREIARETHDPDPSSPARLTFSEWVRP